MSCHPIPAIPSILAIFLDLVETTICLFPSSAITECRHFDSWDTTIPSPRTLSSIDMSLPGLDRINSTPAQYPHPPTPVSGQRLAATPAVPHRRSGSGELPRQTPDSMWTLGFGQCHNFLLSILLQFLPITRQPCPGWRGSSTG